jgi:SAM-dependent methyltransferase
MGILDNYDWGFDIQSSTKNGTNGVRTPLIVSDVIRKDIEGKVFCDLGCGEGDFALACKRYASKVICVELDPERAEVARMKGLDVITGDVTTTIPKADVYYCWIGTKVREVYNKIPVGKLLIITLNDTRDLIVWIDSLNVQRTFIDYKRNGIIMRCNIFKIFKGES